MLSGWSGANKDLLLPSSQVSQTLVLCFEVLILIKILRFSSLWILRPAPNVDWSWLLADQNSHWLQEELTRHAELSPSDMKAREAIAGEKMSQRVTAAVWLLLSPLRVLVFDLQIVIIWIIRMCWKCIYFFIDSEAFCSSSKFQGADVNIIQQTIFQCLIKLAFLL